MAQRAHADSGGNVRGSSDSRRGGVGQRRGRAGRMIAIESLDHLATILGTLIDRGFVRRLPPSPGSRAERYVQLLCPDLHPLDTPTPSYAARDDLSTAPSATAGLVARIE